MRSAIILSIMLMGMPAHAAITVDFDDLPFSNDVPRTTIESRGFSLSSNTGHTFYLGGTSVNNRLVTRPGTIITISRGGGGVFAIEKLDLSEAASLGSVSVMLTGLVNGGSVSQVFQLDGNPSTIQTFNAIGFSNLTSAVLEPVSGTTFSVDNIVTPEPSAVLIFSLAALLLARSRR